MKFAFNSRETYLVAVKQWRAEYAQISDDIRAARREFRSLHTALSRLGAYDYHWNFSQRQVWRNTYNPMLAALQNLLALRKTAREMLVERSAMKVEAGRQMMAART